MVDQPFAQCVRYHRQHAARARDLRELPRDELLAARPDGGLSPAPDDLGADAVVFPLCDPVRACAQLVRRAVERDGEEERERKEGALVGVGAGDEPAE